MDFIAQNTDLAFFILRLALGVLFLAHGPVKLHNPKQASQAMGVSTPMATFVGTLETLGATCMILGVWLEMGAAFLMAVMLGAIYFKTQKWGKSFTDVGGWELDFIILAAALTVLIGAPATYSLLG